jgi:hypothetical protein
MLQQRTACAELCVQLPSALPIGICEIAGHLKDAEVQAYASTTKYGH